MNRWNEKMAVSLAAILSLSLPVMGFAQTGGASGGSSGGSTGAGTSGTSGATGATGTGTGTGTGSGVFSRDASPAPNSNPQGITGTPGTYSPMDNPTTNNPTGDRLGTPPANQRSRRMGKPSKARRTTEMTTPRTPASSSQPDPSSLNPAPGVGGLGTVDQGTQGTGTTQRTNP